MTSKRQRKINSQHSSPSSSYKPKEDQSGDFNPQLHHLTAKKMSLPSSSKSENLSRSPESLKQTLLQALKTHFGTIFSEFLTVSLKWVEEEWRGMRMDVQSRLSKINYLAPTLTFENFPVVQKEVRVEWRKNKLLRGVTYLWAQTFLHLRLPTLQSTQTFYEAFCSTFATVSYSLFQSCFEIMEEKGVDVLGKLLHETAVSFVTELKQWPQIYCCKLQPFFLLKCPSFSENYEVSSIQMNPHILNVHSPQVTFNGTASALLSLMKSITLDEAVSHLIAFRSYLLKEIQESEALQRKKAGCKPVTAEKEDILGCIEYTLVQHKLDGVGCLLSYLDFLLGSHIDEVLRAKRVDCFKTDLEAAYWSVSQPVIRIPFQPEDA